MANVNPLLLVGAVIGVVTALLVFAYASVKDKKGSMGFERNMADGEIVRRLIQYAKPYGGKFIIVGFLVLFSISYDIASPLIVGYIEELVVGDFTLDHLFASVAVYAGVLVFSMLSTYFQAVILQKVGQRIISDLREDLFTHIESLAHEQLNEIPVGKLVTRVTNDTNAISMMFTNLLVNLTKNAFVILGILVFSKYFSIASIQGMRRSGSVSSMPITSRNMCLAQRSKISSTSSCSTNDISQSICVNSGWRSARRSSSRKQRTIWKYLS